MKLPLLQFIVTAVVAVFSLNLSAVESQLWTTNPDGTINWDPQLHDFSDVGYMNGNVPIPDWPVDIDVTQPPYNAVPDDGIDDSQAFIDAIRDCKDKHAVFVPKGRYTILQRIAPQNDYFVLRGEDMFETVLFFPKNINEIYISEEGYDPNDKDKRNTGGLPFFYIDGGTHRSIENIAFEFREQVKMGHWEHKGNDAIRHSGTHSWLRNIYIKNADHGIAIGGAEYISVVNVIFDHFIGRNSVGGSSVVGHMAMNMNNTNNNLVHNTLVTGNYSHEFDIKNNSGNVLSDAKTKDGVVAYHGMGSVRNLFTNLETDSDTASRIGANAFDETYWGVYSRDGQLSTEDLDSAYSDSGDSHENGHTYVGYGVDVNTFGTKTTSNFWYEAIDPVELTPKNIYLAQLEYKGKPVPESPVLQVPSPYTGDVIRMRPVEDNTASKGDPDTVDDPYAGTLNLNNNPYIKFDLNVLDLTSIHRVRLRLATDKFQNTPVELALYSVVDDSWTADTLTFNNRPDPVNALGSVHIYEDTKAMVIEFDVTSFVQGEWAGDKVASFNLGLLPGSGLFSSFNSMENGFGPELIIEQVASSVPGAPSKPTGVRSYSMIGNVRLDWEDNPESDVVTYNVYRSTISSDFTQYDFPIGMGLTTSDFVDIQTSHHGGWDVGMMRNDEAYFYRVTAVDKHGYESEASAQIVGTAIGTADDKLPPSFISDTFFLDNATQYLPYTASLLGPTNAPFANDPEADPLYFSKINGPDWLSVAPDGTVSGTPQLGETGLVQFDVQVNSLGGGRDEATFEIFVDAGAPDAVELEDIFPSDASVYLDWSHDSESSANFTFTVYRSMVSGGPYVAVATGLIASEYTDTGLNNGIPYYYIITASNLIGESPNSNEVFATPVSGLALETNFLGGIITDSASWDSGLPVGQWGRVNVDGTVDTLIELDGYSILHTGGLLGHSGASPLVLVNGTTWIMDGVNASTKNAFRGFRVESGSSLILSSGTLNTANGRDLKLNDAGSKITINGGTLNLGRSLIISGSAGPTFTINGGTINGNPTDGYIGGNNFSKNAKTLNFNGGTTSVYQIDLTGDNTTFNFGGTSTGSLTVLDTIIGVGSNSTLNFLPGSLMSLTVAGEDEWAASRWAAGELTYNGEGVAELGSWAEVSAPDGLGIGAWFVYDSATETLTLSDGDLDNDGILDSWETLHFGTSNIIDGTFDTDGDGVKDFFEYLFGADPNDANSLGVSLGLKPNLDSTSMVFDWKVVNGFVEGIDYFVKYSTDLTNWYLLPEGSYTMSESTADTMTHVELTLPRNNLGPNVFIRLEGPPSEEPNF